MSGSLAYGDSSDEAGRAAACPGDSPRHIQARSDIERSTCDGVGEHAIPIATAVGMAEGTWTRTRRMTLASDCGRGATNWLRAVFRAPARHWSAGLSTLNSALSPQCVRVTGRVWLSAPARSTWPRRRVRRLGCGRTARAWHWSSSDRRASAHATRPRPPSSLGPCPRAGFAR